MAKTNATAAVLGSTEVNYLIYRYLQECGFHHSAFTFAHESQMHRCDIDPNMVPPAALVTYLQKGMQYLEAEANIDESGDIPADFSILEPHEILTHDIDELRALALDRREKRGDREAVAASMQQDKIKRKRDRTAKQRQQRQEQQQQQQQQEQAQQQPEPEQPPPPQQQPVQPKQEPAAAGAAAGGQAPAGDAAAAAMDVDAAAAAGGGGGGASSSGGGIEVAASETFSGHVNDAFICVWSPKELLLATGSSGDATTRLWNLAPGAAHDQPALLAQAPGAAGGAGGGAAKDITTLDWHPQGTCLACGSYDGVARIWGTDGSLQQRLELHTGPIFALKWNKKGELLLTGSADETALVTHASTGEVAQVFQFHTGATLDADWRNNSTFATCSTDKEVHVCKLGESQPLKTFRGHTNEVNCVRWDPAGRLLASCSDDKTARLWSLTSDAALHVFRGHEHDIYTIKWSPSGPGSANPSARLLLATASFDKSVKLWDVESGGVVHCLSHAEPVYSVSFSPDCKYVATGSADSLVRIFSVADGALLASHDTRGAGILEVAWSRVGDKVAASTMSKSIVVCDMRRL